MARTAAFYREMLDLTPVELPRDEESYGPPTIETMQDPFGYQYHVIPAEPDFAETPDADAPEVAAQADETPAGESGQRRSPSLRGHIVELDDGIARLARSLAPRGSRSS